MTGIFMSHSSADKPFARRLGNELRGYGASVWIDNAEIRVGDSLIAKISEGISTTDYLVVLLSKASCESEWVQREVNIALTQEIHGKTVKVLPCLLEDCTIPPFLLDKKYADFRQVSDYVRARSALVQKLGLEEPVPEIRFLEQHVFYDLINLNDGFDVPSIKYFGANDFETVLNRAEVFGISIFGIEPWLEYDLTVVYEMYGSDPADPTWYRAALRDLVDAGVDSHFSASYKVPARLLDTFVK